MNSYPHFYYCRNKKKHSGISPVIASVIILAITVTLGLALWSFVNSEVNVSTQTFASEVTDYINYLNDRFVIVNIAFGYDDIAANLCNNDTRCVTVWIYNNGNLPVTVNSVFFGQTSSTMLPASAWESSDGPQDLQIQAKELRFLAFEHTADPVTDQTYYVRILSESGAQQTYFQNNE